MEIFKQIINGKEYKIKDVNDFEDFRSVIKVFNEPPYCEILDDESCKKEFDSYCDDGFAFGMYLDDKIVGLNCVLLHPDEDHSIKFSNDDKIAYYSGVAVLNDYRKQGIGNLLISNTDLFLSKFKICDIEYARILLYGSMSEKIFNSYGFQDAYYDDELIIDDVTYNRLGYDKPITDRRKYMVKTLSNNTKGFTRR